MRRGRRVIHVSTVTQGCESSRSILCYARAYAHMFVPEWHRDIYVMSPLIHSLTDVGGARARGLRAVRAAAGAAVQQVQCRCAVAVAELLALPPPPPAAAARRAAPRFQVQCYRGRGIQGALRHVTERQHAAPARPVRAPATPARPPLLMPMSFQCSIRDGSTPAQSAARGRQGKKRQQAKVL